MRSPRFHGRARGPGTGRLFALLALLPALLLLASPVAYATSATQRGPRARGQVVIVVFSGLSLAELQNGPMPYARALANTSSLGLANTLGVGKAVIDRSCLTIGAGARTQLSPDVDPPFNSTEPYEGASAGEAYRRRAGTSAEGYAVVAVGLPAIRRANNPLPYHVVPGLLGGSVEAAAGGATAVFGNGDAGMSWRREDLHREGVYVAMNSRGLVKYGDVGKDTLVPSGGSPYGIVTSIPRLVDGYRSVREKAQLVVLDFGDIGRAELFRPLVSSSVAARQRREALAAGDRLLRALVPRLRNDTTLVVVSPVGPDDGGANALNPILVRGPGFRGGFLVSPVTHRLGMVNSTDIAPTLLKVLGLPPSEKLLGTPISSSGNEDTGTRFSSLAAIHSRASTEAVLRPPVMSAFTVFIVLIFAGVAVLLFAPSVSRPVASVARWLLVGVLGTPLASWIMWMIWPPLTAPSVFTATFVALAVFIPTLAVASSRRETSALVKVSIASALFVGFDQIFLSGRLAMATFFSYSPVHAARYYGLGNEGWAILVGALLVAVSVSLDSGWISRRQLNWGVPFVFGLAILVIGFPSFGANAGGVIGATAGLGTGYVLLRKKKLGPRELLVIVLAITLTLAAFTLYDTLRPSSAETHIGRSAKLVFGRNGATELMLLVQRKVMSNLKVMARMQWSYVLLLILAVLAVVRVRPSGLFAEMLKRRPGVSASTVAGLVGGFVGLITEDSGVMIPALLMMFVGASVLFAMLETKTELQAENS